MNQWSKKSQDQYDTLHKDLQILCDHVLIYHDCSILWGYRTAKQQNALYADGKSKLIFPRSSHNEFPSDAVDLIPYRKGYNPYGTKKEQAYGKYFCGLVNGIASMLHHEGHLQAKIKWGGSWSVKRDKKLASFYDGFHWERDV